MVFGGALAGEAVHSLVATVRHPSALPSGVVFTSHVTCVGVIAFVHGLRQERAARREELETAD